MSETIDKKWIELKDITGVFINQGRNSIIITGIPDEDDESRNCDEMMCTSVEHTIFRGTFESSSDHLETLKIISGLITHSRNQNKVSTKNGRNPLKTAEEIIDEIMGIVSDTISSTNTSVTEPSVDRVNDNPIAQAIREFMPTAEQRAGYEALCAWLESVTSFELEGGNEG